MTKLLRHPAILVLIAAASCFGQEWEVSGLGGYAFQKGLKAESKAGEATAGFTNSVAGGVVIGNDMYRRWGGEFRYLYRPGTTFLEADGQKVTFGAKQHIVNFDMLYHFADRGEKTRPFVAFGAGIKTVQGSGQPRAFQPLSQYAILTNGTQVLPVIDVGAGVKIRFSNKGIFRVEARVYMSPGPDEVIAPVPGGRLKGWMFDVVPGFGIGFNW